MIKKLSPLTKALLLFSFLQIPAAFLSLGHHYPDEHFQILEALNNKLGDTPTEALTWEFKERMRPYIQIAIYYPVALFERAIGVSNPFYLEISLRLISVLLAIFAFAFGLLYLNKSIRLNKRALYAMSLFGIMPYLNARISAETVGASIFFISLFLFLLNIRKKKSLLCFFCGFLFAIAVFIRFHLGFMMVSLLFWLLFIDKYLVRENIREILWLSIGLITGLVISMSADIWGYQQFTFTPWNYFYANIIENRAAGWGTSPWWSYLQMIAYMLMPPMGPLIIFILLWSLIKRTTSIFTFLFIPFFIIHSMVGHKEYRFLFPLVLPFMFMMGDFVNEIQFTKIKKYVYAAIMFVNLLWLILLPYKPTNFAVLFYKYVYDNQIKDIYTEETDPFLLVGQAMFFYRPKDYQTHTMTRIDFEKAIAQKDLIVFTRRFNPFSDRPNLKKHCKILYKSIPDFLKHYNINNWLSRVRNWSLYRCRKHN